ncbi:unnamed protein product [Haemonchus placei]|uniref:DUF148 domain-containing protein n=1 Tax=Haemonchus placei TaxID=6290 RepID=A0A0N4WBQ4_HAEPC|nr:unnamed protein product [Haemonchus placei]
MNTTVAALFAVCFILCITQGYGGHSHSQSHSHEHGGERPPKPEFLDKLNDTLREEFWNIVKDRSIPPNEKREKVLAWGEKYGLEVCSLRHFRSILKQGFSTKIICWVAFNRIARNVPRRRVGLQWESGILRQERVA